jgi:hypothetical protein
MPKAMLHIRNEDIGSIALEAERVHGYGGPDFPRLRVPVELTLTGFSPYREGATATYPVDLLMLWGDFEVYGRPISEFREQVCIHASPEGRNFGTQLDLQVPLDLFRIGQIEEKRTGDLSANLKMKYLVAIHEAKAARMLEFYVGETVLAFGVAKSHWIETVLPALGYGRLEIISVRVSQSVEPKGLPKAVEELRRASKFLTDAEWDKAVGHCRSAVEAIVASRKLRLSSGNKTFADKVDAFVKAHLPGASDSPQNSMLVEQMMQVWRVGSQAHHASRAANFSRADAEFLVRMTSGIAEYVGKLLK